MTEIITEKIEIRRGIYRFCAVDNHNKKKGKTYQILYKAKTGMELTMFMVEKGIWE